MHCTDALLKLQNYTPSQNVWSVSKGVVTFGLIKILTLLKNKLVFTGMKQKKKKNNQKK